MDGPAVSFVLLRRLGGFCADEFGRPPSFSQTAGELKKKRRPLMSSSMRPAAVSLAFAGMVSRLIGPKPERDNRANGVEIRSLRRHGGPARNLRFLH